MSAPLLVVGPPKHREGDERLIHNEILQSIEGTLGHGWRMGNEAMAGQRLTFVTDRERRGAREALRQRLRYLDEDDTVLPLPGSSRSYGLGLPIVRSPIVPPGVVMAIGPDPLPSLRYMGWFD